jgi:hypothetical protein
VNGLTAAYDARMTARVIRYRVGSYGVTRSLILAWNGTRWRRVPIPPASPASHGYLYSVAAASARHAWAAGVTGLGTLIDQWNGSAWKQARTPRLQPDNQLFGVAALSARNAWAVGSNNTNGGDITSPRVPGAPSTPAAPGENTNTTLIEHWNGSAWKRVTSPSPAGGNGYLIGVAATSARNAWAVGWSGGTATLIEHWNGSRWQRVRSPSPPGGDDYLDAVAATSARSAWAVGYLNSARSGSLLEHWNGRTWTATTWP